MGSRRWSIFTGGESVLGARGSLGWRGGKGQLAPVLWLKSESLGKTTCVRGSHVRSEGWQGERERQQDHECRI